MLQGSLGGAGLDGVPSPTTQRVRLQTVVFRVCLCVCVMRPSVLAGCGRHTHTNAIREYSLFSNMPFGAGDSNR